MTENLTNFFNACQKVYDSLIDMSTLEDSKLKYLTSFDIKKVEEVATKQQALVMKLESAERNRIKAQSVAGFEDKTTSEILELLQDKDDKFIFKQIFDNLNTAAGGLKISNKTSLDIVNLELNMLKDKLPKNQTQLASTPGKKGYNTYSTSSFQGTF